MAIRTIRTKGDNILREKCKPVKVINEKLIELMHDMDETMHDANGVGLAAPQVGILKRLVVIDIGDGTIFMINPEIISSEGEQTEYEGCLSVPGYRGEMRRPMKLTVAYTDLDGTDYEMEAEGFLAVAVCHELDHLDGVLFVDKAVRILTNEEMEKILEEQDKK